ncbi:sensor histidine kinase [Mucilaginibacter gotjawali]|uniref:histidine kinase n=2 Tax=Mucilaginibacter gotjawali TaxID=1550579 RepID=A0A120MYX6_9SPHI|nr:HAMP domain-containing sensor histidine kinase [Mucilaginibacter gotjawali]MBB3056942.1 signal transduction histidine kinase [Mucilaginibacter gotjawali]BAU56021.1 Alginate biosynthesis sensor protein KinB [Mucilaginibacter gotjawali]
MKRVIISLTLIVLIATAAISVTHYYAVKIISSTRAYINFEAQYAKGEKDATRHLVSYLNSHDEVDYLYFKSDISIPKGDSIAREALMLGKDTRIARIGFLMGGNNKEDLPQLVWFFSQFKNKPFFKTAIETWQQADMLVSKLNAIGVTAHRDVTAGKPVDGDGLILRVNTISDNLTIKQQNFSAILGDTSRMVDHYVFILDLVIPFIILLCSALLAGIMLRKLHTSQKVILEQNKALNNMNERIKKFAYSVTHDLRSPIASLTGLVSVLEREKDITRLPDYTEMMRETLELQDKYIRDVLNTIRNESTKKEEICNLVELVNDIKNQNSFFADGHKVNFLSELEVWELKCNIADIKVVFNNLISNAVKYADFNKPEQWIKVKSYRKDEQCIIEIEDNGLGIKSDQKENIFKKYFKSGTNKKSMGLGLYFAKQAIEEMNGTITVKSLPGKGTSFIVALPL